MFRESVKRSDVRRGFIDNAAKPLRALTDTKNREVLTRNSDERRLGFP